MQISSSQPGNIFASQQKIVFDVSSANGEVRYELKDYFGKLVIQGNSTMLAGQNKISIKGCPPGWYELKCTDQAVTVITTLGVVIDRKGVPLPVEGRICADAASAWLLTNTSQRRPFAQMVAKAGIPWVRERLSWEGIEKQPGVYDWSHFQSTGDTFKEAGVNVFQVWHMTPEWTRAKSPKGTLYPEDLRTVYRFTKEATSRWGKQWQAWEAWNEPDIAFWPDLSDRLTGYLKAAYLGLKAGDPTATVTQCSLCTGPSAFSKGLYQNGLGDYYDVFNWHLYNTPSSYPESLKVYREQLASFKLNGRPAWLTEAGIRLTGTEGDDKRILSDDKQRLQCQFLPQSAVMSLVAGNDRHFFFVLPDYLENGVQFGVLKPDLSPYPGFVALSTAANMLGLAEYIGEYRLPSPKAKAYAFTTSKGNLLVAWSETPTTISLSTDKASVTIADIFGSKKQVLAVKGSISVPIGPDAVYIEDVSSKLKSKLSGSVIPRGKLPKLSPSPIVVVGHADMATNKGIDSYILRDSDASQFVYSVEVYNFSSTPSASGTISVSAPSGWLIEHPKRRVQLEAMGRESLTFNIKPSKPTLGSFDITAKVQLGSKKVAPAVSHFMHEIGTLPPTKQISLRLLDAKSWQRSIGEGGTVLLTNPDDWSLLIDSRFTGNHDRWSYPAVDFKPARDFSEFDGIAFDLTCDFDSDHAQIQMMLVKKNGAHYISSIPYSRGKQRVVILFENMNQLAFMPDDPEHKLTLNEITGIKLGCNTKADQVVFKVSDLKLVKFASHK